LNFTNITFPAQVKNKEKKIEFKPANFSMGTTVFYRVRYKKKTKYRKKKLIQVIV
jgi:hypothetical protein